VALKPHEYCLLCGQLLPKDKVAVLRRTNITGPMKPGAAVGFVCLRHSVADLMAKGIGVTLSQASA
jgi:hypothetical protein